MLHGWKIQECLEFVESWSLNLHRVGNPSNQWPAPPRSHRIGLMPQGASRFLNGLVAASTALSRKRVSLCLTWSFGELEDLRKLDECLTIWCSTILRPNVYFHWCLMVV